MSVVYLRCEREDRTKHLQGLPDGLFIENTVDRVIAVLDTLHVLWRRLACGEREAMEAITCHLDQRELLDP